MAMNFLLDKIKDFLKHRFVKDVAILQVGNFIMTLLSFVASMVFARVLGPEDYGKYVIIFAFTALAGIFMQWGADYATLTILPEAWAKNDKEKVKAVIIYFIKLVIIIGLTVGFLLIVFSEILAEAIYHNKEIGGLARIVILANIIRFSFIFITVILQSIRRIKFLAIIENIEKATYIILPVVLIFLGLGLSGIVWGYFLAAAIFFVFSIIYYFYLSRKEKVLPTLKEITLDFRKVSIRKFFNFGFLIALDKNLASLYTIMPLLFLGRFVSSDNVGFYKIAFSYVGLSLMLLNPISRLLTVQLPKSKTYGIKELRSHFLKSTFYSFLMISATIIPMVFLSRYLVTIFYGIEYLPSVKLIYWLWPYVLITVWGVGLGPIFRTLNKMKVVIFGNLIILILGTPIVYWLVKNFGLRGMVISCLGLAVANTFAFLIYIYQYLIKMERTER